MAENKAEQALKEAPNSTKPVIKVYYSGETPGECGSTQIATPILDGKHWPWLFKYSENGDNTFRQFINSGMAYRHLSAKLKTILDAVIVNAQQRKALDALVDEALYERLCRDHSHEDGSVIY